MRLTSIFFLVAIPAYTVAVLTIASAETLAVIGAAFAIAMLAVLIREP